MERTTDDGTRDPLESLLRAARPHVDRPALVGVSDELARAVRRGARRTRRRRALVATSLLALGVVPSAAAAGWLPLGTGWFGQPDRFTEDADGSEWLNLCSPQLAEAVQAHRPDRDLPAGWSWDVPAQRQVDAAASAPDCGPGGVGMQQQEIAIDVAYEAYERCAWLVAAADAQVVGDEARRMAAGDELLRLAGSPVNRAIDGGGVVEADTALAQSVRDGVTTDHGAGLVADCRTSR